MIDGDLNKNKSPLCDNSFRLGIKEEMRIIIKTLSVYFNAESACIAVNPYHDHAGNRGVETTNTTNKDKSYVVAAYNDIDLENSIPVAMDGRDEPFEFLEHMSSQDDRAYSRENWFTFFTLEPKLEHSWEGNRGQLYSVIRFFAPEAKTSNESLINSPVILGAACFVFRERGNLEEHKVFLKELVRLMLLVKGSLQNYLQKKFLNDNFRRWINKAERLQSYELRINKYQHGAAKHLADLKEAAQLTGDITVITYAWIVSAEIFIGENYARIIQGKGVGKISWHRGNYRSFFKALPGSYLSFHAERIIKQLSNSLIASQEADIKIMYNDNQVRKKFPRDLFYIIISLLLNAKKYSNPGYKTLIVVQADSEGISIINNNLNDNSTNIIDKITSFLGDNPPEPGDGITIFTINKYLEKYGTRLNAKIDDENKLCLQIPLLG